MANLLESQTSSGDHINRYLEEITTLVAKILVGIPEGLKIEEREDWINRQLDIMARNNQLAKLPLWCCS